MSGVPAQHADTTSHPDLEMGGGVAKSRGDAYIIQDSTVILHGMHLPTTRSRRFHHTHVSASLAGLFPSMTAHGTEDAQVAEPNVAGRVEEARQVMNLKFVPRVHIA